MPIFEYQCLECGEGFETLVFGDQDVCCPKCSAKNVKKLLSTFSHKSNGKISSSKSSSCSSCNATSCKTCGIS
ncbi:MAG: zinc ribbon domain-containing protein [Deltaproteobacteria bacterium]|nr:MAG: zinc ribbon domain-containing protein [Deltaproteobacteria bacterium]